MIYQRVRSALHLAKQPHPADVDYLFPTTEFVIKKGRDPFDLSLLSDILVFSLEPALTFTSKISTTAISSTTSAWGLWLGFVDCQCAATKLGRI